MGFRTILLDPPWLERGGGRIKRGADRHYPLIKTRDMPDVIRGSRVFLPADDAHLWMWSTNNKLPDALWLGAELGFTYKSNVAWVKTPSPRSVFEHFISSLRVTGFKGSGSAAIRLLGEVEERMKLQIGIGQYLRGSHELLLFFTRGRGQSSDVWNGHRDVRSVIRERRTKHSRKPVAGYELIERVSKGPRVELFARSGRPGWLSWGNGLDRTTEDDG